MRNMAVLHSPAISYPLPVLVRVLSNLLIFKGKILYYNKDSERRAQHQAKSLLLSEDVAEPHPILYKDSERRAQHQAKSLLLSEGVAEPHPILYKDSERRAQLKIAENKVFK